MNLKSASKTVKGALVGLSMIAGTMYQGSGCSVNIEGLDEVLGPISEENPFGDIFEDPSWDSPSWDSPSWDYPDDSYPLF